VFLSWEDREVYSLLPLLFLLHYDSETFDTEPSQMNLIVSRSHMHISRVTMINRRLDTRCGASTNSISAGFDLVGLKSRRGRGFTAGRTWFRAHTVATENSRDVIQFDV
jgi:hypothetical protein